MIRAHIQLNTTKDYTDFVQTINSDGTADKYIIMDDTGEFRASARSLLGVICAAIDYNDRTYLVNETNDGVFPSGIDKFRKL